MKVFISQPMWGKDEETIMQQRKIVLGQLLLRYPGTEIEIIDNWNKPEDIVKGGRLCMLGHSIMLMKDADLVVFIPGWKESRGCQVERDVCIRYGYNMLDWETLAWEALFPPAQETK